MNTEKKPLKNHLIDVLNEAQKEGKTISKKEINAKILKITGLKTASNADTWLGFLLRDEKIIRIERGVYSIPEPLPYFTNFYNSL